MKKEALMISTGSRGGGKAGTTSTRNKGRRPSEILKVVQRPKPRTKTHVQKTAFEFNDMMFADLQRETIAL